MDQETKFIFSIVFMMHENFQNIKKIYISQHIIKFNRKTSLGYYVIYSKLFIQSYDSYYFSLLWICFQMTRTGTLVHPWFHLVGSLLFMFCVLWFMFCLSSFCVLCPMLTVSFDCSFLLAPSNFF